MTIRILLPTLFISLFFSACMTTPDVPLSEELKEYSRIQGQCEDIRISVSAPDSLHVACDELLKRFQKTNDNDYKMAKLRSKYENPKGKPEYIQLQTIAHRQHLKTELEYKEFIEDINHISLDAIENDNLADVELTLTFLETEFTKAHYDYYKMQSPQHQNDTQFLIFEKRHANELVIQGLGYLSNGDKKHANQRFKVAAELNNAQAEFLIGVIYEAKHIDKAIEWHTKAKEHGVKSSGIHLARLYLRKHEPKESQKFYLEAAENEDAYAQYLLYEQYKKTSNTKSNAMANEWVQKSAANGFPPAEYAYGQALLKEKRRDDAKEWLIKAQEHGVSAANGTLGALYFKDKEYTKAFNYLNAAKSSYAKYRLAQMYEKGLGIDINYYQSYMLYKESVKLGRKKAKKDVARLAKLKTGKEQAHHHAAKRKEKQRLEAFCQRCGEEPILRNLRTKGMKINLRGRVSLPLQPAHGFIVSSDDGRQFYVIDIEQKANVKQYQHVDITAKATGNAITISSPEGLTTDIYQLNFQTQCQN